MVKIAVATEGQMVAEHFGHCSQYSLFDIEGGKVIGREVITNPGHQPGFLPGFLADLGVNCVIVGGIGARAVELFGARGIEVITGARGPVEEAVSAYLGGNLKSTGSTCSHDHEGHEGCEH
ncbi:dinitrogenase iron-molybdenum cofactor [Moorella thermoacetica]|uniref:Dinitrogenase iron-molybdenum cofactor n=1 Tax=Neomoorella thermoacetica TaxID=1525 RepID=A0A1J5JTX7_NEOTH|nr:NifB/NifX family molybdenum-iron cluster-binding protein [Moorella thermoacetica]OIQ08031.1 dinitrogenase iron-molybdenum cofactor [Moorella thermoacetica]